MVINRVGPVSCAKITGTLYAILGLIIGACISLFALAGGMMGSDRAGGAMIGALMADAAGQLTRRPGICVSTLGPGAMNLTLGVANAFLDRSPMIAITAAHATTAARLATHQNLDLNAVFRPFTKQTITLTAESTAATVRRAWRTAVEPRFGPVHLALPSDVARREDRQIDNPSSISLTPPPLPPPDPSTVRQLADKIKAARRPIVILGLDLDPMTTPAAVKRFVEALGVPVFVTPK